MKRISLVIVLLAVTLIGYAQPDFKKLDAYYAKALKDWGVPGMSIAIVKDGKVVFAKGYGVKEAGKNERPDDHTLYAIASNTKAFTSAAIAQLVDEEKIAWNDKVKKYLPYFELYDPWVSSETNIRDILSHRVGLGTFSGDIIWYRSTLSAEEIVKRAKYLPRDYDFRSGFGYSNVMFIAAGEVIQKVTGQSWDQVIHSRFLQPLGMSRTVTSINDLQKKGNYATPHSLIEEVHKPIPWEDWSTVAATGGIISSVNDMSQWLMFNLSNGIWKNDTLLSKGSRNMLWTPHNTFPVDFTSADKSVHFRGYALGWTVGDYRGKLRVGHTGGYSGMLSGVSLIPDENLGIVILTNGMKGIYTPLLNYTIDAFLKAPEKDWSSEMLANSKKNKDTRVEEQKKARVMNTKSSLPLDSYAGKYFTETYGTIEVKKQGDKLKVYFEHTPDLTATLEHWHYDVFELKWDNPDLLAWFSFGTVKFELDNHLEVKAISFDVPNNDFWFEELNAKRKK